MEYYYHFKEKNGPYITLLLPSNPDEQKPDRFYCPVPPLPLSAFNLLMLFKDGDDGRLVGGWGLFYVFDRLAVDDLLLIFSFIMQEQSVLVMCKLPGALSAIM